MNKNQLTLNPLKSHALAIPPLVNEEHTTINISLNACTIKNSECVKYLGILVDSKLNFRDHINVLQNKLLRAVGIMSKLRYSMVSNILKRLYFVFFHSHLLYRLIIWSATFKSYLDSLKKLQNRAIRIITNADRFENRSLLFRNLKILQLDDLIKLEAAKFMNSFDNNALPPHFGNYFRKIKQVHNRSTCSSDRNLLYLPRYRSNRLQRSIKFGGHKVCNDIPFELKSYYKIGNLYKHHLSESY